MPRTLASVALAAVIAFGSVTVANSMQGPRTGNLPGPERPMHAQESPSGHMGEGSTMMGQGQDMMGNPQMRAQMDRMKRGCACCQEMAQKDRKPSERR